MASAPRSRTAFSSDVGGKKSCCLPSSASAITFFLLLWARGSDDVPDQVGRAAGQRKIVCAAYGGGAVPARTAARSGATSASAAFGHPARPAAVIGRLRSSAVLLLVPPASRAALAASVRPARTARTRQKWQKCRPPYDGCPSGAAPAPDGPGQPLMEPLND